MMVGDDDEAKSFTNKKDTCLPYLGCIMAQILGGMELGWVVVLYCTVWLCTYLIRTRWGMSDLLHYQAYCNKARRERQTERGREKRQGKGRLALEHSAMSPDQPFPTGRVCMGRHGGGSFLGMHQSVRLLDGCIRRFLTSTHVARTAC